MSDKINYDFLFPIKQEYEILKCIKEDGRTFLFKIRNLSYPKNEVLKVINAKSYKKENVENYLNAVRKLNEMKSKYLMELSLIKEENGYIYLIMGEYYGSLEDYELAHFLYSSLLRGQVRDEKCCEIDEKDEGNEDKRIFRYCEDILKGLKVIHDNGLCHGDISNSNIFANEDTFILSDYCLYLLDEEEFKEKIKEKERVEKEKEEKEKQDKEQEEEEGEEEEEDDDDEDEKENDDDDDDDFKTSDKRKIINFINRILDIEYGDDLHGVLTYDYAKSKTNNLRKRDDVDTLIKKIGGIILYILLSYRV